ncbi:nucleotidyltransferase family protein [Terriglobus sp. TAA 43]|uniref:nucleotidyltransferase family protein n=1 Tax=Terriglobus sp. TAA 43 TaxID=278961 RepID=UPI0006456AA5|nr:nucleotidyltransferase domain-containing protein [Terriglobus sp. TAA 43]
MNGRHEIESRREQIVAICREHGVARLLVFGSVTRDDFNPETSDIDFLVQFLPGAERGWMSEFTDLKEALQKLFGRKVDVISERALKNPYMIESVDQDKELLYAA